jgi:hypothetical protein
MSNYTDFREFYNRELHPVLEEINLKRKAAGKKIIIILTVAAALIMAAIFIAPVNLKGVLIVITVIASLVMTSLAGKGYRRNTRTR